MELLKKMRRTTKPVSSQEGELLKIRCKKCFKVLSEKSFYHYKDGTPDCICKNCLVRLPEYNIEEDNFKGIENFCKRFDIPFIEFEYTNLVRQLKENSNYPDTPTIRYGRYLAKMKLPAYKECAFQDSSFFNFFLAFE